MKAVNRRSLVAAALLALALLWWSSRGSRPTPPPAAGSAAQSPLGFAPIRRLGDGSWGRSFAAPIHPGNDGLVHVRGTVKDAHDGTPVGGVDVVFSGAGGEAEATASADGTYEITIAPGAYRAFVRGDGVMSVGVPSPDRLPGDPADLAIADAPVTELAPAIAVERDAAGVDLPVERGGTVTGHVTDRAGHPIAHALVHAHGELRPVLGGDVAESDASGVFTLELPAGNWELEASHPDYAGGVASLDLLPGTRQTSMDVTMDAGCIVRGHVFAADGGPAGDGALEARVDGGEFSPAGRIEPDGSYRLAIPGTVDFDLRAWPWKSPPSKPQSFKCSEGARFDADFELDRGQADLDGTIATADGRPAAGAFLDVIGTSDGAQSQQERADASGAWAVYALPPGDYVVTATIPGEGAVTKNVRVPAHGVALALGGTGAIDGTIKGADDGTLEMALGRCDDQPAVVYTAPETRLVPVHDGRFHLDRVPACSMYVSATVHGRAVGDEVTVHANEQTAIALDATPPRKVTVTGRVIGENGRAAPGALVRAWNDSGMTETTAGADGSYRLEAEVGSELVSIAGDDDATGEVPTDAPDTYNMDLRLERGDAEDPVVVPDDDNHPL